MRWFGQRSSVPAAVDLTLDDIHRGFEANAFTSAELAQMHLDRISEVNDYIKAVAEIDRTVLEQADILDAERARGKVRGPLHGVTLLIKNQIATHNLNNTSGSTGLLGARTGRDSAVVTKLRDAGAIILGTSNMTQWGNSRDPKAGNGWSADVGQTLGVYYENQDPWGSSTGSAIGTALGLAFAALGTEVEGSIVCAAERSNLCGLKPTVGLVSRDLVIVSPRLGSVGPLARCVKDAAAILGVIAGQCDLDPATKSIPFQQVPDYAASCQLDGLHGARIGIPRNALRGNPPLAELTPTVAQAFEKSLDVLRSCGAIIVEDTDFTSFDQILTSKCPDVVKSSDLKARLADYFSSLVENPTQLKDVHDLIRYTQSDPREDFPSRGTSSLEKAAIAIDDQDSDEFKLALKYMNYLAHDGGVAGALQRHQLDALILPTCVAPIVPALGGYPMLSVPLGFYPDGCDVKWNVRHELIERGPGLPFGLSFIGASFSEEILIKFAYAFEQATQVWRQRRPINLPSAELPGVATRKSTLCSPL